MVVTVGSMQILCVLRDQGAIAALSVVKNKVVEVGSMIKNTTVEMGRMSAATGLLSKMLGMIGIGGFVGLLMAAPRTSAEITKLMNHLRQIALVMDKYVAPVIGAVADVVGWMADKFKELPEPWQKTITYGLMVAGALGAIALAARLLGLGELASWAWSAAAGFAAWAASLLGVSVPMLVVVGLVGALAAYIFDWGARASGFYDWLDKCSASGSSFAGTLILVFTPLTLIADIINVALGKATWDRLIEDIDRAKVAIENMGGVLSAVINMFSLMPGMGGSFSLGTDARNWILGNLESHATGGIAGYSGLHILEAGEQIIPNGFSRGGGSGSIINITNNFGGVEVKNDMDLDTFAEENSKRQAQKLSWMAM